MRIHKNLLEESLRRARATLAGAADAGWQEAPVIEVNWRYNGRGMRAGDACPALITTAAGLTAFALSADDLLQTERETLGDPEQGTVISWLDLMVLMWQEERDERTVFYFPGLEATE